MKKLLKKAKKPLVAAFAAAAAMTGMPAHAADNYQISDGATTIDVYEVNQSEGMSIIAEFNAKTSRQYGTLEYYIDRMNYISEHIKQDAMEKGYSEDMAAALGRNYAGAFTAMNVGGGNYILFDERNPNPFNGVGPYAIKYENKPANEKVCALVTAADTYTPAQWIKSWVNLNIDTMPDEYGPMFSEFANFHERAHCYSSSESNAEYIAALQMLNKYRDQPEKVESFLWFQSSMRNYRAYSGQANINKYLMTGTQSLMAMRDFKENPQNFTTTEDIYSVVRKNTIPNSGDAVRSWMYTFRDSLEYLQKHTNQPLCHAKDETVKVTFGSPRCA